MGQEGPLELVLQRTYAGSLRWAQICENIMCTHLQPQRIPVDLFRQRQEQKTIYELRIHARPCAQTYTDERAQELGRFVFEKYRTR